MATNTDDRYVVLLGKLGNGLSSTGNTLLGRNAFKSKRSMRPVTLEPRTCRVTRNGRTYHVVDTPGFFYPGADVGDILRHVQSAVKLCPMVHAFLIVYSGVSKLSKEESMLHLILSTALGQKFFRHAIVRLTHGHELFTGNASVDFLNGSGTGKHIITDCMGFFCKIENRPGNVDSNVENLFKMIETLSRNGRIFYRCVNAELKDYKQVCTKAFANKDETMTTRLSNANSMLMYTGLPQETWVYIANYSALGLMLTSVGGLVYAGLVKLTSTSSEGFRSVGGAIGVAASAFLGDAYTQLVDLFQNEKKGVSVVLPQKATRGTDDKSRPKGASQDGNINHVDGYVSGRRSLGQHDEYTVGSDDTETHREGC